MRQLALLCDACGGPVPLLARPVEGPIACPACGREFPCDGGILDLGAPADSEDYPDDIDALLVDVEPRHFWFEARNELLLATMRELVGPLEGRLALDIGCGTGFVLAALERAGIVPCGLDMQLPVLRHARRRTRALLARADAAVVPFEHVFDVALLCDVIEHTPDDVAVLRAAARALIPGGSVVVTVPAHPELWSPLDVVYGHKRRYVRRTLVRALESAGLRVVAARYFNALLYPLQLAQRLSLRRLDPDRERAELLRRGLQVPPAPLNAFLKAASRLEIPLSRVSPPLGTSLVAVARVV
jgi:SAM-dependent methyltransferase